MPQFTLMSVRPSLSLSPISEFPPECQMAGRGFPGIWRFLIKVCGELKVTCHPILHSSRYFSSGETECSLCCISAEAYHFTPTCQRWPARGPTEQDPLCVFLMWKGAQCVLDPGEGCDAAAKLTPVILPLNANAHRNLTSGGHFSNLFQNRKFLIDLLFKWQSRENSISFR